MHYLPLCCLFQLINCYSWITIAYFTTPSPTGLHPQGKTNSWANTNPAKSEYYQIIGKLVTDLYMKGLYMKGSNNSHPMK